VDERDTQLESPPDEAVGWSRAAQDAADAAAASLELEEGKPPVELEREPPPFLNRPVGYGNYSSVLVVFGGVVGAIVGVLPVWGTSDSFVGRPSVYLGFGVGCLTIALVLAIVRLKSSSPETEASWRQRLADWISLR
jgi:hypothetical protein